MTEHGIGEHNRIVSHYSVIIVYNKVKQYEVCFNNVQYLSNYSAEVRLSTEERVQIGHKLFLGSAIFRESMWAHP